MADGRKVTISEQITRHQPTDLNSRLGLSNLLDCMSCSEASKKQWSLRLIRLKRVPELAECKPNPAISNGRDFRNVRSGTQRSGSFLGVFLESIGNRSRSDDIKSAP